MLFNLSCKQKEKQDVSKAFHRDLLKEAEKVNFKTSASGECSECIFRKVTVT